jgi:hypothetical protein
MLIICLAVVVMRLGCQTMQRVLRAGHYYAIHS